MLSVTAKNTTGSAIPVGKAVYITGSQGSLATIALADNDGDPTSSKTFGLTAKNVADNGTVEIIMKGKYKFNGLNTNAFTEGTSLWLGDDGNLLQAPPVTPKHAVFIGYLEIKGNNSTIIVDVQNGFELGELHDVLISSPVDNEVLTYESGLWKNKPASGGGSTIQNISSSQSITTGNTYFVDASSGEVTLTITTPASSGTLTVKKIDSTSNAIYVQSALLIDGNATAEISTEDESIDLVYTGTTYYIT